MLKISILYYLVSRNVDNGLTALFKDLTQHMNLLPSQVTTGERKIQLEIGRDCKVLDRSGHTSLTVGI